MSRERKPLEFPRLKRVVMRAWHETVGKGPERKLAAFIEALEAGCWLEQEVLDVEEFLAPLIRYLGEPDTFREGEPQWLSRRILCAHYAYLKDMGDPEHYALARTISNLPPEPPGEVKGDKAMKEIMRATLFGMALGDALAAPTEFMSVEQIVKKWGSRGPDLMGQPALVTDDTQMALAVGQALIEAFWEGLAPETVEPALRKAFIQWLHDPRNNRAPGNTCLTACRALERGERWQEATLVQSKGCGANMRVVPVGLLLSETPATRAALAQFQAALTHGHPTALAASDLTAHAVYWLATGGEPGKLLGALRAYGQNQSQTYHEAWLGDLWRVAGYASPHAYIAVGWRETLEALDHVASALKVLDREADPCLLTGDGWVAEEALATALLCFLMYPDEPEEALRRAAVTRGDSDSIACLAGSFAGAHLGGGWPDDWTHRIEYREALVALATFLSGRA